MTIVWFIEDHDEVTERADRITATQPHTVRLPGVPQMVWLEHSDESRVGTWRTTWMAADGGGLTESETQLQD